MSNLRKAIDAINTLRALGLEPTGLALTTQTMADLQADGQSLMCIVGMGAPGEPAKLDGVPLTVRSTPTDQARLDEFDGAVHGFGFGV